MKTSHNLMLLSEVRTSLFELKLTEVYTTQYGQMTQLLHPPKTTAVMTVFYQLDFIITTMKTSLLYSKTNILNRINSM